MTRHDGDWRAFARQPPSWRVADRSRSSSNGSLAARRQRKTFRRRRVGLLVERFRVNQLMQRDAHEGLGASHGGHPESGAIFGVAPALWR
jgi:hypothetical protein